jgi:pseudouridine-5'-phosphate glycosidase
MSQLKPNLGFLVIADEVRQALEAGKPVVALESTVITHGLPYPQNLELARNMEQTVREQGAVPATIGVLEGVITVGLGAGQVERLAQAQDVYKISVRDFAPAVALKRMGGTTVAGTLLAASAAGIQVFATGGIGGVHRQVPGEAGTSNDISTDLMQLARTPMVVVCAGAKAILDLPATLEMLETLGVPVVGYQTSEFPAFYSTSSGLPVSVRVESAEEAAQIAHAHWGLGLNSAVLVTVPPPAEAALPHEAVEGAIETALGEVKAQGIRGQAVSPYLLGRVSELTEGHSLEANLALLLNNARVAAQISKAIQKI